MQEPTRYTLADLATLVEPPEAGILSRAIHTDVTATTILFGFSAGEELTDHAASRPATIHVLTGELELTVEGERIAGPPGTWLHMAAGMRHGLRAVTASTMLLTLLPVLPEDAP